MGLSGFLAPRPGSHMPWFPGKWELLAGSGTLMLSPNSRALFVKGGPIYRNSHVVAGAQVISVTGKRLEDLRKGRNKAASLWTVVDCSLRSCSECRAPPSLHGDLATLGALQIANVMMPYS